MTFNKQDSNTFKENRNHIFYQKFFIGLKPLPSDGEAIRTASLRR